jgi:hypothetical protein
MDADSEKLGRLIIQLFDSLASLEEELVTYKTLVSALQQIGKFDPTLEAQREGARPAAKRAIDEKYAPVRKLLGSFSEGHALVEFLEKWEPGAPN